jgi:hypothetical protein
MAATKTQGKQKQQSGGQKQYDDTNRGVLFQNDKGDNENRPDMTGNLAINPDQFPVGEDGLMRIRLAAWSKHTDTAGDFLSISASVPQQKQQ